MFFAPVRFLTKPFICRGSLRSTSPSASLISQSANGEVSSPSRGAFPPVLRSAHHSRTLCATFLFLISLLPLAAFAAESAEGVSRQIITVELAVTGVLSSLVTAIAGYFIFKSKGDKNKRQPPLGEDVARTYATKTELDNVEKSLRGEIASLRDVITENDKKSEDRVRSTHARIDEAFKAMTKTNKALGVLIGIMVSKNKIDPSAFNIQE